MRKKRNKKQAKRVPRSSTEQLSSDPFDDAGIPFIPDFDLLSSQKLRLSDTEVCAIASALHEALPSEDTSQRGWEFESRISSLRGGL